MLGRRLSELPQIAFSKELLKAYLRLGWQFVVIHKPFLIAPHLWAFPPKFFLIRVKVPVPLWSWCRHSF
jgi:hypothetical protein